MYYQFFPVCPNTSTPIDPKSNDLYRFLLMLSVLILHTVSNSRHKSSEYNIQSSFKLNPAGESVADVRFEFNASSRAKWPVPAR